MFANVDRMRANSILKKLCCCMRQEERVSCQSVRATFHAERREARLQPGHPAVETGICDSREDEHIRLTKRPWLSF